MNKKVIIDTNVYSNAMRGEQTFINIFQQYENILFSPIVIGELLAGFRRGTREKENRKQLKFFLNNERIAGLNISSETSEFYSFILNDLRTKGTPIPVNDIWIAASAMEHGAPIASDDSHFIKINGIDIVRL